MAYLQKASGSQASTSSTCAATFPGNLTVGNLVVVGINISGCGNQTDPSITGVSLGTDTLTMIKTQDNGTSSGQAQGSLWAGIVKTASQTVVTATVSGGPASVSMVAGEWAGYSFSQDCVANSATGTSNTPSTGATGTRINPTSLIIAVFAANTGSSGGSLTDGFSNVSIMGNTGSGTGKNKTGSTDLQLAEQEETATTSHTGGNTVGASCAWAGIIASFAKVPADPALTGFVQQATNSGTGAARSVTLPANATVGNLIVVCIGAIAGSGNQSISSLSGLGATGWTRVSPSASAAVIAEIWAGIVATAGTDITVNLSNSSGAAASINASEWNGYTTTTDGSNAVQGGVSATKQPGNIDTTNANDLIIAIDAEAQTGGTNFFGPGSPWSELVFLPKGALGPMLTPIVEIVSATGSFNPTFTQLTSTNSSAAIVALRKSGAQTYTPTKEAAYKVTVVTTSLTKAAAFKAGFTRITLTEAAAHKMFLAIATKTEAAAYKALLTQTGLTKGAALRTILHQMGLTKGAAHKAGFTRTTLTKGAASKTTITQTATTKGAAHRTGFTRVTLTEAAVMRTALVQAGLTRAAAFKIATAITALTKGGAHRTTITQTALTESAALRTLLTGLSVTKGAEHRTGPLTRTTLIEDAAYVLAAGLPTTYTPTKDATYRILLAAVPTTKDAIFKVIVTTAPTKDGAFKVLLTQSVSKDAALRVLVAGLSTTEAAAFKIMLGARTPTLATAFKVLLLVGTPSKSAAFQLLTVVAPSKAALFRTLLTDQSVQLAAALRTLLAGKTITKEAAHRVLLALNTSLTKTADGRTVFPRTATTLAAAHKATLSLTPSLTADERVLLNQTLTLGAAFVREGQGAKSIDLAAVFHALLTGQAVAKGAEFRRFTSQTGLTEAAAMRVLMGQSVTKDSAYRALLTGQSTTLTAALRALLHQSPSLNAALRTLLVGQAVTKAAALRVRTALATLTKGADARTVWPRTTTAQAAAYNAAIANVPTLDAAERVLLHQTLSLGASFIREGQNAFSVILGAVFRTLLAGQAVTRSAAFNQFITQTGLTKTAALRTLLVGQTISRDAAHRTLLVAQHVDLAAALRVILHPTPTLAAVMRTFATLAPSRAGTFRIVFPRTATTEAAAYKALLVRSDMALGAAYLLFGQGAHTIPLASAFRTLLQQSSTLGAELRTLLGRRVPTLAAAHNAGFARVPTLAAAIRALLTRASMTKNATHRTYFVRATLLLGAGLNLRSILSVALDAGHRALITQTLARDATARTIFLQSLAREAGHRVGFSELIAFESAFAVIRIEQIQLRGVYEIYLQHGTSINARTTVSNRYAKGHAVQAALSGTPHAEPGS